MKPIIFFAFANDRNDYTKYLRNLPKELDTIENVLKTAEKQGFCEIEPLYNTNFKKLFDLLQDSRYRDRLAILHFGGHGEQDLLVFETEDGGRDFIEADAFVHILSMRKNLQFVFLNACNTQEIAEKFAKKGIAAVGTKGKVYDDEMLLALVYRFYNGIAEQMTLQEAWEEAVLGIKAQYKANLDLKYKGELFWELHPTKAAKSWKIGNNLTNLEHNKHSTEMGLEEFKQELLELIDICEMNTFFAKVEKCPYDYNKSMYHSLKNQFMMTNPMLNPCFMFSGQWKTFVGTLKEKK